jgi:hypothetical protein
MLPHKRVDVAITAQQSRPLPEKEKRQLRANVVESVVVVAPMLSQRARGIDGGLKAEDKRDTR